MRGNSGGGNQHLLCAAGRGISRLFDLRTLSCLFLTLAVVAALRNIKFFTILARKIVAVAGNLRTLALALIYITFIGSMLIANDMALITFLPLGYFALTAAKQEKHMAYIFILQNISANLGGMLTPFGNPQNLYLYSYFRFRPASSPPSCCRRSASPWRC